MIARRPSPEQEGVWRFVRGDTAPKLFERWVCAHAEIEQAFGQNLYLDVISADYSDTQAVHELKARLGDWAHDLGPLACRCITLSDLSVVDMGEEAGALFSTRTNIVVRGEPYWWLFAQVCQVCGDPWLVAQEERQNDVYCMRRLSSDEWEGIQSQQRWPSDFDMYESLLRIGREAGKSVRFMDPMNSSLRWTIQDLAKARPGIRVSELASLLNLDANLASSLAREAMLSDRVDITLDLG